MGLQLEKTGPRENPIKILHITPHFEVFFIRLLLDFWSNGQDIFFHILGKRIIKPNNIIIPALSHFRYHWSTQNKIVVAFNKTENNIIENIKDPIIMYGLYLSWICSKLPDNIIGNKGSTHGARIVNIHAKNEINGIIIFMLPIIL